MPQRTLSSPVVRKERDPRGSETRYTVKVYAPAAARNERGALLFTQQIVSNTRRIKAKIADLLLERGLHARACSFAPDNNMIVVASPSTGAKQAQVVKSIGVRKFRVTKKEAN
jgi:hypothetical protein